MFDFIDFIVTSLLRYTGNVSHKLVFSDTVQKVILLFKFENVFETCSINTLIRWEFRVPMQVLVIRLQLQAFYLSCVTNTFISCEITSTHKKITTITKALDIPSKKSHLLSNRNLYFTIVLATVSFFLFTIMTFFFLWMLFVMPSNTKLVLLSYLSIHLAYTISSPEKNINKRAHQNVLQ